MFEPYGFITNATNVESEMITASLLFIESIVLFWP